MDTSKIHEASTPDSPQIIYDFLSARHTGVLCTTDESGTPHGAVIYFLINDDFTILFGTKTKTRKYVNAIKSGTATLIVYDEDEQITTAIEGTVAQTDDPNVVEKVISNMEAQAAKVTGAHDPPIAKLYAGDFVALTLTPRTIRTAIYTRPDNEGYDEFETITFNSR